MRGKIFLIWLSLSPNFFNETNQFIINKDLQKKLKIKFQAFLQIAFLCVGFLMF